MTEIPVEAVENALEAKVNAVDASKNLISTFPEVIKGTFLVILSFTTFKTDGPIHNGTIETFI